MRSMCDRSIAERMKCIHSLIKPAQHDSMVLVVLLMVRLRVVLVLRWRRHVCRQRCELLRRVCDDCRDDHRWKSRRVLGVHRRSWNNRQRDWCAVHAMRDVVLGSRRPWDPHEVYG